MFFFLGITSGFFTSLFIAIDDFALSTYHFDSIIYGLYSELLGILTAFIFIIILSFLKIESRIHVKRSLGALIDPDFQGLILPTFPYRQIFKYIMAAGLFGGVNTLFYFLAIDIIDSALIQPLLQFITLYLLIFEIVVVEKEWPTIIEIMSIQSVVIGGILLSISGSISGKLWVGMFFVLGPINLSQLVITYFQQKARTTLATNGRYVDALNIRFWFVTFMTIAMVVFSIPFYSSTTISTAIAIAPVVVPIATIAMSLTFISYVLYIRLLSMGKMSIVNSITSISVVFSLIFSVIIRKLTHSTEVISGFLWTLKLFGVLLLISGIVALSLATVSTYIFVKCKSGSIQSVWQELQKHNFKSIALTLGNFDIIIHLTIRSMARVHSLLVKKIENISGIDYVYSLAVLKEWERI